MIILLDYFADVMYNDYRNPYAIVIVCVFNIEKLKDKYGDWILSMIVQLLVYGAMFMSVRGNLTYWIVKLD